MKKRFFSEPTLNLIYPLAMNTEKGISLTALSAAFLVFLLIGENQQSSTLPLLVIIAVGFILSFRFSLAGNILLSFGGASLMIQPLLFTSSYGFIPAGALLTYTGLRNIIKWWKQNNN